MAAAEAKLSLERERKAKLQRVADIENSMAVKESSETIKRLRPVAKSHVKAPRPINQTPAPSTPAGMAKRQNLVTGPDVVEAEQEVDIAMHDNEDSTEQLDEYVPPDGDLMDDEDDDELQAEPITSIKQSTMKASKPSFREEVQVLRSAAVSTAGSNVAGIKRKSSTEDEPSSSTKKSRLMKSGGISEAYKVKRKEQCNPLQTPQKMAVQKPKPRAVGRGVSSAPAPILSPLNHADEVSALETFDEQPSKLERDEMVKVTMRSGAKSIVKIEHTVAEPVSHKESNKFNNSDLTCHVRTFRQQFVPRAIQALAAGEDPWSNDPLKDLDVFQEIFDSVFEDSGIVLAPREAELEVLLQRFCEYRSALATKACNVVKAYLMCDELPDAEDRAAEANYLRGTGLPFAYEAYDSLTKERSGTFLSDFIVNTFSVHLSYVKQGFKPSIPPTAGLALTTAAVERALEMWKTGEATLYSNFDYGRWSKKTTKYMRSTKLLSPEAWEMLHARAEEVLIASRSRARLSMIEINDDDEDDRENLMSDGPSELEAA